MYRQSQKKAIAAKDVNQPLGRSFPVGIKRRVDRKTDSLVEYYSQFSTEQSKKEKNDLYASYVGLKVEDSASTEKNTECYSYALNYTPTVSVADEELYKVSLNVESDGSKLTRSRNAVFIV